MWLIANSRKKRKRRVFCCFEGLGEGDVTLMRCAVVSEWRGRRGGMVI